MAKVHFNRASLSGGLTMRQSKGRLSPTSDIESSGDEGSAFQRAATHWDLEQDYEQRPRKKRRSDRENTRLPIKTADGEIKQLEVPKVELGEDSVSAEDVELSEEIFDPEPEDVSQSVPLVSERQQILDAKEELARIATLISEDPEEHAGGFRTLAKQASSSNITVQKLALATQLAVYKDVIPGYRIRPISEREPATKVSKEVRQLWNFEQALVTGYQGYVRDLGRLAKQGRSSSATEGQASLGSIAIACACTLLTTVPHFNFRGELLQVLVNVLKGRIDQRGDFRKCRETLETLFREDEDGTPSLDAVTLLTKMMKAREFKVDESVLNTFLHLRLLSEFSAKGSRSKIDAPEDEQTYRGKKIRMKREFRTKKQRKLEKERKVVAAEMKDADATVSHEERDRMQADSLKLVFATYFRILKARSTNLMGAVLEGLVRYAHLINQDFFGDLLEALRELIIRTEESSIEMEDQEAEDQERTRSVSRESLLCVVTAFALLQGQDASKAASTLHLDLSFFIAHLYRTLYPLAVNPDLEFSSTTLRLPDPNSPTSDSTSTSTNKVNMQTTIVLLLRCLTAILLPPLAVRAVPPVRLAAFTKQLSTSALQLPEKSCLAILGLLNTVTKTHGRKINALWNTEERKGDGIFDPLRPELESSNPFASTIWEGEILRKHFCPRVREAVEIMHKNVGVIK